MLTNLKQCLINFVTEEPWEYRHDSTIEFEEEAFLEVSKEPDTFKATM